MATKNRKWFQEFSEKFNVQYQVVKGNDITVHVAVIGGERHTALAQLSKAQIEALFKRISEGKAETMENTVTVTAGGRVSLNGTRYSILETIAGIKVNRLLDILDNSVKNIAFYDFCNWLYDNNNRWDYLKTINGGWNEYLQLEYYFQTGEIKSDTEDLIDAWNSMAEYLAECEGVELIEDEDEFDDYSDLKYPVGA